MIRLKDVIQAKDCQTHRSHILRNGDLEKLIIQGKVEVTRRRERVPSRYIDQK